MSWVGRPLPRYEDPVLLQGRGAYTADFAQHARPLRFVRSPVARGRILGIKAPPGVTIITAAPSRLGVDHEQGRSARPEIGDDRWT